jgi:sugar phosphate isomerase/epimerase
VDTFAALCDQAKPLGLTVDLEFPSFSRLIDLREAVDIVRAAGRTNGGIMIDTLYVHFSRVALTELGALPREWFHMAHFCDAPAEIPETKEGKIQIARGERLYAGEGAIDLAGILQHMPPVPLSLELPNTKRAEELGYEEFARRCLQTAKHYVETHLPKERLQAIA